MGVKSENKLGQVLNKLKTRGAGFVLSEDQVVLLGIEQSLEQNDKRVSVQQEQTKKGKVYHLVFNIGSMPEGADLDEYAKAIHRAEAVEKLSFTGPFVEVTGGYIGILGDSYTLSEKDKMEADVPNRAFYDYVSGAKTIEQIRQENPELISNTKFRRLLETTEYANIVDRNLKQQQEHNLSYETSVTRTRSDLGNFERFTASWLKEYENIYKVSKEDELKAKRAESAQMRRNETDSSAKTVMEAGLDASVAVTDKKIEAKTKEIKHACEEILAKFNKKVEELNESDRAFVETLGSVQNYICEYITNSPSILDKNPEEFRKILQEHMKSAEKAKGVNKNQSGLNGRVFNAVMDRYQGKDESQPEA